MTYRDDSEALREQLDTLRDERDAALQRARELESAGDGGGRFARLEAEITAYERHLAELKRQVRALRPADQRPRAGSTLLVVGALASAAVVGGVLLLTRGAAPPAPPVEEVTEKAPAPEAPAHAETPSTPAPAPPPPPAPTPAEPAPAPSAVEAPPPDPPPSFPKRLRWEATVRTARGVAVRAGNKCDIDVEFIGGDATERRARSVSIACGRTSLFDTAAPPDGATVVESLGRPVESGRYAFTYRFIAAEGQTYIDTAKKDATVVRQGRREFRVELTVNPVSREAPPLPP